MINIEEYLENHIMTYRTAVTFEKPESKVLEELATIEEWVISERFFNASTQEDLAEGAAWFEMVDAKLTADGTCFEVLINYHDAPAFLGWWEAYGSTHEEIFSVTLQKMQDKGIIVKRYFEDTELVSVNDAIPMAEFVSQL
jgi:hypothetical protein